VATRKVKLKVAPLIAILENSGTSLNFRVKLPPAVPRTVIAAALAVCFSVTFTLPVKPTQGSARAPSSEIPVRTKHAMVVSIHHLATDAGVEILREGGNAVDSAVATGFALAVVYPAAGNIGGGGFMLIHLSNGKSIFIDYREKAPLAASANMYLDEKGDVIPNASIVGYRAVGVPGSVAGMAYAEKKYGKLTLAKVMEPAIRLASEGFELTDGEARELHESGLAQFPESKRIFQRDGNYYAAGDLLKQLELAQTLSRIAKNPEDFYRGKIAKQLVADVQKGGGLITAKDLASYHAKEREPVTGTYRGYTIVASPPPSSGGIALIEALNILEGYDLASLGDRTPREIHLVTEAFRRAYMDRSDCLGDPDYVKIPIAQLTDKKYAAAWRANIQEDQASASASLKRPSDFVPPPPTMSDVRHESTETTHYSVVDAQGNAVAVTTTLNNSFGSDVTAAGLGFLLNDEMDDFASKQGVPNMFGLIQGPANSIAPGKRPLSSMAPTIVLKDGKVSMILGSPGGGRIITTVANIFLSVVDEGLNIQAAVDAPRFHHQYLPDVLYLEPGFSDTTIASLRAMGYNVEISKGHWSDGECIAVDPANGDLEGGQDHRNHFGKAAGF
jgi:gamma-glutamyltranspeptidase / glutathione hydrolase